MTVRGQPHPHTANTTPSATDPAPPSSTARADTTSRPRHDHDHAGGQNRAAVGQNEAASSAGVSLIGRAVGAAIHAAHAHLGGSYERRHSDWQRWTRRRTAATWLALTLGLPVELVTVPVELVTVDDDPDRAYGYEPTPGDLFTAHDRGTTTPWRFIPDWYARDGQSWLLLGACPHCPATAVPIAQIGGLADLGAHYLAPPTTALPVALHGDPAHHPECPTTRAHQS